MAIADPALWLDQVGLSLLGALAKSDSRVRKRLPVVLRRASESAARSS
jgi:hypothetical protein